MAIANRRTYSLLVLLLLALFSIWGCPKRTEITSAPQSQATITKSQKETPKEKGSQVANPATKPGEALKKSDATAADALKPIYFDFESSVIREDAKDVMKANAAWLKAHPNVKIKVEGNSDAREAKKYNFALGRKRAETAKKYLTSMGISGRRLWLVGYGKEKSVCTENTESCWQKNRRVEFVVNN
ncbi:MAG TPA: OmpA family protein [Nitrospirota bacterium]|nr:OmpA family protein [Nitrospirota bacterium]